MSAQSESSVFTYAAARTVQTWAPLTAHFVRKVDEGVIVFCGKIAPSDAVKAERYLKRLIAKTGRA